MRIDFDCFGKLGETHCEWGACGRRASHVRFYATTSKGFTPSSRRLCQSHVHDWRQIAHAGLARLERLIDVEVGSELHVALDCAWHTLAIGAQP